MILKRSLLNLFGVVCSNRRIALLRSQNIIANWQSKFSHIVVKANGVSCVKKRGMKIAKNATLIVLYGFQIVSCVESLGIMRNYRYLPSTLFQGLICRSKIQVKS